MSPVDPHFKLLLPCLALFLLSTGSFGAQYRFEPLGRPLTPMAAEIALTTPGPDGRVQAWAVVEAPEMYGVIGVSVDTGETQWIDLADYGYGHIQITSTPSGKLYLYAGNPGHFLKYDIASKELTDLGAPARDTVYWLGQAVGPDGKLFVGVGLGARLVYVDPATDEIKNLGSMADDPKNRYLLHPVVSDANVLYGPIGLHHPALVACDVKSGQSRQILPEELKTGSGMVSVWVADDGQVYGERSGRQFRCHPDRIEYIEGAPPARSTDLVRQAGDYTAEQIDTRGRLILRHRQGGEPKTVQTQFPGVPKEIFCISCERDGKVYGGGGSHQANTFTVDMKTAELNDHGRHTRGGVQVYDILSHPRGLFYSSYVGANLDFWNPETNERRHIATLEEDYDQERAWQLTLGPDGMIYTGTRPIKGHLGGAVVRVNPEDFSFKLWRNVIPNQSFISAVAVPKTGEIFFTSSVQGGTSAAPTETEAYVMLWDCAKEEMVWKGTPLPGTTVYGKAAIGTNGIVYGLAGNRYFAFDPVARRVIHTGELPVGDPALPGMVDEAAGPQGLIFGLGDGAIFAIDPADHQARIIARHESIDDRVRGMYVTQDGVLYYSKGSELWRVDLYP